MEGLIVLELKKKLRWRDMLFVILFKKTSVKIYKIGIERGINAIL